MMSWWRKRKKSRAAIVIAVIAAILAMAPFPLRAELTLTDEKELGLQFYNKMNDSGMLVKNPNINQYLADIGNIILEQTDANKRFFDFKFSLVKTSAVNAFATPGGFVYINRGLLTTAENEGELAGVVAHEIGHIIHRHIASLLEQRSRMSIATLVAALAGALLAGDVNGLVIATGVATATSQMLDLKYSRGHEEEADRSGLQYLVAAGYDPICMLTFLRTMGQLDSYSNVIPSYMLTHPGTTERLTYLDAAISSRYKNVHGSLDKTGRFQKIQTLLVMGMSNSESSLRYFEERLRKNPGSPYFSMGIGSSYLKMGRMDKAREYFEKALDGGANDSDILREVGIFKYKSGEADEVIQYLKRSLEVEDDETTKLYLGQSLLQQKKYADVLAVYSNTVEDKVTDPDVFNQMALAYGHTGDNASSHYFFGAYFEKTDKKDAALFHYRQAAALFDPSDSRQASIKTRIEKISKEIEKERGNEQPRRHQRT